MSDSQETIQAADMPERVALDEFCRRLSQSDRRVEMISGFAYAEAAAGRQWDIESEFAVRFQMFTNKPA